MRHDVAAATRPSVAAASPRPTGQLVSMTAIAVAISLPTNQSAIILTSRMFIRTAPVPLARRPTAAGRNPPLAAVTAPPTAMRARLATTTRRSPKRWPSSPPGIAKTAPGRVKRPTSVPTCA